MSSKAVKDSFVRLHIRVQVAFAEKPALCIR